MWSYRTARYACTRNVLKLVLEWVVTDEEGRVVEGSHRGPTLEVEGDMHGKGILEMEKRKYVK